MNFDNLTQEEKQTFFNLLTKIKWEEEKPARPGIYTQPETGYWLDVVNNICPDHTSDRFGVDIARAVNNLWTNAAAEREQKRIAAKNKLVNLAREREKTYLIDWMDSNQIKYRLEFSYMHATSEPRIYYEFSYGFESPDSVYFCGFKDTADFISFIKDNFTQQELEALAMPKRYIL